MLKVFLVEDEFIIRNAIKRTVNWDREGFELVGEAGDGERAFPMIMKSEPDILLTDIRMPFMDGLELSRLVKKNLPRTKIVILSGYDDFSYAKEAISIGITEYLLKPVSGQKLLKTLKKLAASIAEEQSRTDYKAFFENEHNERLRLERNEFLKQVLDGRILMADALERGETLKMDLTAVWYGVVLVQIMPVSVKEGPDPWENAIFDLESRIAEAEADSPSMEVYEQVGGVLCFLIKAQTSQEVLDLGQDKLQKIRQMLKPHADLTLYAAIGQPVGRLSKIHHSYHSATRMFTRRFTHPEKHIYSFEDETGETYGRDDLKPSRDISAYDFGTIDRDMIFSLLRNGSKADIPSFLNETLSMQGENNLKSELLREYILMDLYISTVTYLKSIGYSPEEIDERCGKLDGTEVSHTLEGMKAFLNILLERAIGMREAKSESRYSSLIAEARAYIERHYRDNDISLPTVAESVGVSPNHFSRIFSRETGKTFIEFLTETRMDKARQLLKTTSASASDIGLQIGYSDPHYFYYIFKKTQGMTPKEYRAGQ